MHHILSSRNSILCTLIKLSNSYLGFSYMTTDNIKFDKKKLSSLYTLDNRIFCNEQLLVLKHQQFDSITTPFVDHVKVTKYNQIHWCDHVQICVRCNYATWKTLLLLHKLVIKYFGGAIKQNYYVLHKLYVMALHPSFNPALIFTLQMYGMFCSTALRLWFWFIYEFLHTVHHKHWA